MTPEEFEVAFCKGKCTAMEDFAEWLDDHITVVNVAIADGVSHERVLDRTMEFMQKLIDRMNEKLKNGPRFIARSAPERTE